MRILLASHSFFPAVGGVETASLSLATEFRAQGHVVRVVTATQESSGDDAFLFKVIRQPGLRVIIQNVLWAEVVIQNNISLRTAWPALMLRRPLVISVATWLRRADGRTGWQERLKRLVLRRARVIAVSEAIARSLPRVDAVINNSYRDDVFKEQSDTPRNREFVFVGRLVSDKGVDTLVRALSSLDDESSLTVVGDGPERGDLELLASTLGVGSRVRFVGVLRGSALVNELNHHHTIVVPSRWAEPFGIVALEGIACGCIAVVSDGGGLPEAAGPAALTFPNGDVNALKRALNEALDPIVRARLLAHAKAHLDLHLPGEEARRYLEVARTAVGSGPVRHD